MTDLTSGLTASRDQVLVLSGSDVRRLVPMTDAIATACEDACLIVEWSEADVVGVLLLPLEAGLVAEDAKAELVLIADGDL